MPGEKSENRKQEFPVGRSGFYNHQVCIGGFLPTLEDLYCRNSPHGLSLLQTWFFLMVRDKDGGMWAYNRTIGPQSLPMVTLWHRPPGATVMASHPESDHFFLGMCSNLLRKDHIRVRSLPGFHGAPFDMTIDPDAFHLTEGDKIDLAGNGFGLAANTYYPQHGEDLLYSVRFYEAEGNLLGHKVHGSGRWVSVYGPPGQTWETMRIFKRIQLTWVAGFNFYDNGEKEMFTLASGNNDWSLMFASAGNEITGISRFVKAEIELDQENHLKRCLYTTPDAGDWEWTEECQVTNTIASSVPIKWALGPTKRVGETRGLSFSCGWIEYSPQNRI